MICAALVSAWVGLVLCIARSFKPAPARVRALATATAGRSGSHRRSLSERVGTMVLGRVPGRGRAAATSREVARRTGRSVLFALACLMVWPPAAPAAAVAPWIAALVRARRAERRRAAAIAADLPEVVDLLSLAVGAGLTVPLALAAVSRHGSGPLSVELGSVVTEARMGRRLADSLERLPARVGESIRPLVNALVASERYGAPLAAGMDRLADDVRLRRRRSAEEAARRVPIKLLFPLVLCVLPAFALLTVAPLIAGALGSLSL